MPQRLSAFALGPFAFALWAAPAAAQAGEWVACSNMLMCVRAPCPSTNLLDLATGAVSIIHQTDDSALSPEDQAALNDGAILRGGSRAVLGVVERRPALGGFAGEEATTLVLSALGRATTEAEREACRAQGSPMRRPPPPGAPALD